MPINFHNKKFDFRQKCVFCKRWKCRSELKIIISLGGKVCKNRPECERAKAEKDRERLEELQKEEEK